MAYIGSWKIDDLLTFVANTHNPTNGMAQNSAANPSYHVYEDETVAPILTGTMATLNNPNTLGFYSEQITLSAANGFEKGKSYNIYILAVVANVTGTMSHSFQIEAEVDANTVSTLVGINTGTFLNAMADTVWDELLSGHLAVGSAGHTLFSRMPTGTVLVGDKTGFFLGTPQNFDLIGNISGTMTSVLNVVNPVGLVTGTFLEALADKVWDEQISQHLQAGSTGEKLNAAGGAGDPWQTSLPGTYTPGQAGHILASRMPTGTVIVGTNQDKSGYFLGTPQVYNRIGNTSGTHVGNIIGNLSGSVGQLLDIASALGNKIADYVLRRSAASARASSDGDSPTFRSLLGAMSKLVNRWNISGSTLTVYQEDDTTAFGTQTATGDASAEPITQLNTD